MGNTITAWTQIPEVAAAYNPARDQSWKQAVRDSLRRVHTEMPALPANPWSTQGLAHAEASLLERFPAGGQATDTSLLLMFAHYVGHGLTAQCGGSWLYVPKTIAPQGQYGVAFNDPVGLILATSLVEAALERRTASVWTQEYARAHAVWEP